MAYPNLKQSVWLVVLLLVATSFLGWVLDSLGAASGKETRIFDYLVWILNLPVFALLVLYAQRRSGRSWSEVLLFRTVPCKIYLPLFVSNVGLMIILTDLGAFVQYLIPIPKEFLDIFIDLMGSKTPLGLAFYVLAIQAPLTEEVLCRGVYSWRVVSPRYPPACYFVVCSPVRRDAYESMAVSRILDSGYCIRVVGRTDRFFAACVIRSRAEQFSVVDFGAYGAIPSHRGLGCCGVSSVVVACVRYRPVCSRSAVVQSDRKA